MGGGAAGGGGGGGGGGMSPKALGLANFEMPATASTGKLGTAPNAFIPSAGRAPGFVPPALMLPREGVPREPEARPGRGSPEGRTTSVMTPSSLSGW